MGAHDDREMLQVAIEECGRLERENAEMREGMHAFTEHASRWTAERDAARANSESMRELARLHTDACFCTYGENGPEQGCPQHGDIAWFAAGLAIVRAERDALAAWKANAQTTLDYDKAQMDGLVAQIEQVLSIVRETIMAIDTRQIRNLHPLDLKSILTRALATAPADALATVRAEAWDEGCEHGGEDYGMGDPKENPYRTEREKP